VTVAILDSINYVSKHKYVDTYKSFGDNINNLENKWEVDSYLSESSQEGDTNHDVLIDTNIKGGGEEKDREKL